MAQLVRAPTRKAGDPSLDPGPGENFFLKLINQYVLEGYSEKLNFRVEIYLDSYQFQAVIVVKKTISCSGIAMFATRQPQTFLYFELFT